MLRGEFRFGTGKRGEGVRSKERMGREEEASLSSPSPRSNGRGNVVPRKHRKHSTIPHTREDVVAAGWKLMQISGQYPPQIRSTFETLFSFLIDAGPLSASLFWDMMIDQVHLREWRQLHATAPMSANAHCFRCLVSEGGD